MSSEDIYTRIFALISPIRYKPTRLYIKRIGSLWYFGKSTQKNIVSYKGSGVIWKSKMEKYGSESIEHMWNSDWYTDPYELQIAALQFSIENDIVNSPKWANLIYENGLGGILHSDDTRTKISRSKIGIQRSILAREAISKGKTGKKRTPEAIAAVVAGRRSKTNSLKGTTQPIIKCPHCFASGGPGAMKRWHFDNCDLFTSMTK